MMISNRLPLFFYLVFVLLPFNIVNAANVDFSQDEINYLKRTHEIRKCVDPLWMPFEAIDEDGRHIGIIDDITDIMSKEMGVPIILVPTKNWDESRQFLKEGHCDILTSDALVNIGGRPAPFQHTSPFLQYKGAFITQKSTELSLNFEAISGQKIGFVKGYPTLFLARDKFPNIQIIEVESIEDGVLKVSKGELYAFVELLPTMSYSIQKHGLSNLKVAGHVDIDIPIVMSVSRGQAELLSILNKSLAAISNQTKNTLYNKWVSVDYVTKIDYWFIVRGLLLIAVITIISLYWFNTNRALRQEIITSKERDRLMRDIHDGVGGHLIATIALLDSEQASKQDIKQSVMDCLADLRVVILSLDPGSRELAILLGMFRHNIKQKIKAAGMTLVWHVGDVEDIPELNSKSALNILRILQEAVSNAIKHSGASFLSISTEQIQIKRKHLITIEIMDDGDEKTDSINSGYGIKSMKKRAAELGGKLDINSNDDGNGTTIVLQFTL